MVSRLGAPGSAVDLTEKRLQALADFTTARNFTVGSSTINTNAFHLTLDGTVTANGELAKEGIGVLTLNGTNVWNGNKIYLFGGTLQGNAASLGTDIQAPPQARAAFDSIAGVGRAALAQTGVLNQRAINQNIVARLGVSEGGNAAAPATGIASRSLQVAFDEGLRNDMAPMYAQALPSPAPAERGDAGKGFWVRGYGGSGRLDGDANAAGADFRFNGVLAGVDRALGNGLTLGIFGGYAEPRSDQDGAASSARTRNHQLGTYGRYRDGAWYVDGIASYARQDTDASRLVVAGPLVRTASGSYDGYAWAAHLETGYSLDTGMNLIPMAALSWLRQTQEAYDERGAGGLNLSVPRQQAESLRTLLGARAIHAFQAGGARWTLEGHAAWAHEFNDPVAVSARLAGDPTAAIFSVTGPAVPRDSAVAGAGVATEIKRDLRFYADLNTEFNSQQRAYALGAGLRYPW